MLFRSQIVSAQREVVAGKPGAAMTQLESALPKISPDNKPLALYWLGSSKLASDDPETQQYGILNMLRIPALYGKEHPELAAAGLYRAMEFLTDSKDTRGSVALRNELLLRYGQTSFAAKLKSRSNDSSKETP